jgi:hypothetical protein
MGFDDGIDIKKIKTSKLYQKFLKETGSKPAQEVPPTSQAKKDTQLKDLQDSKIPQQKQAPQPQKASPPKPSKQQPKQEAQEEEDDDVPYYMKKKLAANKVQKQSQQSLQPTKSIEEKSNPSKDSPKKSNSQDSYRQFDRNLSRDPNDLTNPEIRTGTPVRLRQ